jgi:DNA-binding CsgD family transcriptional regulator
VQSAGGENTAGATVGILAVVAECAAAYDDVFEAVRLQSALRGLAPRASAVAFRRPGELTGRRGRGLTRTDAARAFHEASAWTLVDAVGAGRTLADRLSRRTEAGGSVIPFASPVTSTLTPRELDVLIQLARGASNKVIAESLGMTPKTVMHHSLAIYRKLGVHTRAEAAVLAVRQGLVPTED